MPSDPTEEQKGETDAMIASWAAFRKGRKRDGIRPVPRIDGRSFQAGWRGHREWAARASDAPPNEQKAQQIVDSLRDEMIERVPNVAVKAAILAIRSAYPVFKLSEENEERLMQVGLAAGMLAARASDAPPNEEAVERGDKA